MSPVPDPEVIGDSLYCQTAFHPCLKLNLATGGWEWTTASRTGDMSGVTRHACIRWG
ncbi:hypothetical protein [Petrimonas sp.]|uniref:hypothetical protein n=1 Tax=Petrimonas sp. TaxID=2023866 RepID=UPI00332F6700